MWSNKTGEKQHNTRMNGHQPVQATISTMSAKSKMDAPHDIAVVTCNTANGWDRDQIDEKADEAQEQCEEKRM